MAIEVCSHCFNDPEIQRFIESFDRQGSCPYCNRDQISYVIDIKELADFFIEFVSLFRRNEEGVPLHVLIEQDWNFFSDHMSGQQILNDFLEKEDCDLKNSEDKVSYSPDISECVNYWFEFKEIIKWKTRFLTNANRLEELHWNQLFRSSIPLSAPLELFRARVHHNDNQSEYKTEEMGSPSGEIVSAGRANPQGIPFLYLSRSLETTLYEVRASYLDDVSVGTFSIKDGFILNIIDFTESASLFGRDMDLSETVKGILLKRQISQDLSKPLRRYDSELDYIPTQFICEYIKYLYKADGILFDSSLHKGGKNIVLFSEGKISCTSVQKVCIDKVVVNCNLTPVAG